MSGPNGKILAVKQSDDDHAFDLHGDIATMYAFTCAWCHSTLKVYSAESPEQASEEAVNQHHWLTAQDDDQIGTCCRRCVDKS